MGYYDSYGSGHSRPDNSKRNLAIGLSIAVGVALLLTLIIMNVTSLTNSIIADAEKAVAEHTIFVSEFDSLKSSYETLLTEVESSAKHEVTIPNIRAILERENVSQAWQEADSNATTAQELATQTIPTMIERDNSDDDSALTQNTTTIRQAMEQALTAARGPERRVHQLIQLVKNAEPRYKEVNEKVGVALATSEKRFDQSLEFEMTAPSTQAADGSVEVDKTAGSRRMSLRTALDVVPQAFPPKKEYFEEQFMEYTKAQHDAVKQLKAARTMLDKGVSDPGFDAGQFDQWLRSAQEQADMADVYLDQMTDALQDLNTDERLYITAMKKSPQFWVEFGCETWGSGSCKREYQRGWQQTPESIWNGHKMYAKTGTPLHESSSSSDSGSSEWVEQVEIRNTYTATFVTAVNGVRSAPETRPVTAEEFEDYYDAGKMFAEKMPKAFKMRQKACSAILDEGEPVCLKVSFGDGKTGSLLIEAKTYGQFEDEASEVPAPEGMPMANVGDKQYGHWEDEGAHRTWHWSPWYSHHYHSNGLLTGYLLGSMMHGGYGYGYGYYRYYDGWRSRNYANSGNWRYNKGGSRTYVGKTRGSAYRAGSARAGKSRRGGGPGSGK